MKTIRLLIILTGLILYLPEASAGDSKLINYSGRILKPDSTAIDGNVTFSVKVYSPGSERCVLWHEQQVVSVSKGVFSISIGSTTNRISGLSSIDLVFKNSGTMTSLSCASGTSYTPSADDDRKLVVSFNDGSGSQTLSDLSINSVPFATTARNAEKISGTTVSGTAPSAGQVLKYNGTEWVPDTDVSGGTPADATTGSKGIVQIGAGLNVSSGTISVDTGTTSGKIPVLDGTNKIPIALLPSIPIDQIANGAGKYFTYQPNNVACATNEFLKWDGTKWICGTAGGGSVTSVTASAPLQSSGGATPGISFVSQSANTVLAAPDGSAGAPTFRAIVAADVPSLSATKITSGLTANRILIANGTGTAISADACATGQLIRFDGTSWQCEGGNTANQHVKLDGGGKLPTLDGSALTNLPQQLPSQTGNSGKYLTTNGSSASWGTVAGGSDNLGNHIATQNLDLATFKLIGNGSTQLIYLPNQANFTNSLFIGNGGGSLSHSVSLEGFNNTGVGIGTLTNTTTGYSNTALGTDALFFNTTGFGNTAAGGSALLSNTTGANNTAIGAGALQSNTSGVSNTATGGGALLNNTTGASNTATGESALNNNTTGTSNTAHGAESLFLNTTGSYNAASGYRTLFSNTTGDQNTAIGESSLYSNKAKSQSTAIGYRSMQFADDTTTAATSYNTAVGAYSLQGSATASSNTGIKNTAVGHSSLKAVTSGWGNIAIGYDAGSAITTGSNNVVVGSDTGSSIATSSNNILINDGAGNRRMTINSTGNVGIGTTSPETKLDVNGAVTMRQAYYESVGALGTLSCGSTNITGFTTNIYTLTACSSGTTTLNIPTITGWPTGNMSWVVSFYVTGQTSSVFNVSYNGATTAVYWDKNSTGGSGGASYPGFNINSGSTDIITCTVINTGSVKVYCGVAAQY